MKLMIRLSNVSLSPCTGTSVKGVGKIASASVILGRLHAVVKNSTLGSCTIENLN
jgi:Ser-tRNA(Ala) deacylase AlaX